MGLYFTAISVVASTAYAKVPGDVRSLVIQEKVSNFYIRVIALLCAMAILSLAAHSLGIYLGILNLFIITFFGIATIFGFVKLGTRIFYFFDPALLVDYLASELLRWVRLATPSGLHWREMSFQAHYQTQADSVLATYKKLIHLVCQGEYQHLREKSLSALGMKALVLLELYIEEKVRIPNDSNWFRRVYQHRDWMTTDFAQISVALETDTTIQPETVPDLMWVEEDIVEIVASSMRALIEHGELGSAAFLGDGVQNTLSSISEKVAIDEALLLFRKLKPIAHSLSHEDGYAQTDTDVQDTEILQVLGLLDVYGLGLVNIILGITKHLRKTTDNIIRRSIEKIDWGRIETIHAADLPRAVIEDHLEYLRKGIDFEHAVEGRTVSPLWYQVQIATLGYTRYIEGLFDDLIEELKQFFSDEVSSLFSINRYLFAAQLIQRGLEACHKHSTFLEEAEACFDRLLKVRRVDDIPWTEVNWNLERERISEVREHLIVTFGKLAPELSKLSLPKTYPDYFGHAYSVLAHESYSVMATGKEDLFKKIFPSYFISCLTAYSRLITQLDKYDARTGFGFSTAPIMELLDISGYALIYSELEGNKHYWDTAKELWDKYFTSHKEPNNLAQSIVNIVNTRRSLLTIFPRDYLRTSWQQDLGRRLRQRDLLGESAYELFHGGDYEPKHPSPVIRALTRGHDIFFSEAATVFLVIYLLKRPETKGLDLSPEAESFAKALEREQKHDDTGKENEN